MTPRLLLLTVGLMVLLAVNAAAQTSSKKVTVLKRNNDVISGVLVALNEKQVVVRRTDGNDAVIVIDDVYELVFDASPDAQAPQQPPKPAITPSVQVEPATFARCLNSFRRILSAVEIGVTYMTYRQELLEAKIELDQAIRTMPESAQRTDFLEALEDLRVAADAWQVGIQNQGIPTKTDFYRSLNARYKLGVDPKIGRKVDHSVLLKIIWATASDRLAHAASLQP